MNSGKSLTLVLSLLVVLFLSLSVFQVDQTQRAIILRLGQIQMDGKDIRVLKPGLHFKVPFIDSARFFDQRIQTLDIQSSRIPTQEKKELIIDLFNKWRIKDFSAFFRATGGNIGKAEKLLYEKTNDGLRAEIGRRPLNDVVSEDRDLIMAKISKDVNLAAAKSLGIEVVDARIVRIDLPREVSEAVYGLMRTERNRIAADHRAKGKSRAESIRANADAKVTVIMAEADQKSREIRGDGDALAARIYEASYSKDPEFFRFYRSLEAYKNTFQSDNDMLVLKPDSDFFKYFHNIQGPKAAAPVKAK